MSEWTLYIRMIGEQGTDSGDGLTLNFRGKIGQTIDPVPVVYINGVPQSTGYTYNPGDVNTSVSVTFTSSQSGKSIRLDYRWKKELDMNTELTGYELQQLYNVKDGTDVNGKNFITESYSKIS